VAEAFVEGDHSLEVNHIDGNKLNCHYTNLEWVSSSQNLKHAWDSGLRCVSENTPKGEAQFLAKLTNDAVYEILTNLDKPCRYFAEKYNTSLVTINDVQTGKKWKHLFPDIVRKAPEGGKRKLSNVDVIEIRKSSKSSHELSKIYGLSRSSIREHSYFCLVLAVFEELCSGLFEQVSFDLFLFHLDTLLLLLFLHKLNQALELATTVVATLTRCQI
jgi:hypothetical protein